jgi:Fe2+ or Zn2+ uptake regulation protein
VSPRTSLFLFLHATAGGEEDFATALPSTRDYLDMTGALLYTGNYKNDNHSYLLGQPNKWRLHMISEKLNSNAQAVLNAVQVAHNHPTALEVYEAVKPVRPHIGLASVYRILHHLSQQGYIKELERTEEGKRYDAHIERHDHAICAECGALLDIPIAVALPIEVLQAAASAADIELQSHELRIYGRCRACRIRNAATE